MSTEDLEEPLTPAHLLIGRRLSLSRVSEEKSLEISQEALSKKVRYLDRIMAHFWKRWRSEYLFELRDCHCYNSGTQSASQQKLNQGEVALLHDEKNPRIFWKIARIEKLLSRSNNRIRGAVIRVPSKSSTTILRRPLKCLYPLEISCEDVCDPETAEEKGTEVVETPTVEVSTVNWPRRVATQRAREWLKTVVSQMKNS